MLQLATSPVTLSPKSPSPLPSPPSYHSPRLTHRICSNRLTCLHKTLGRGAYGYVELAVLDGVPVAIKRGDSSRGQRMLGREIRRLQKFSHPSLIGFYGTVVDKKGTGIVLEHMEGTLEDVIAFMSIEEGFSILKQIASALEYLHTEGYYHGDVKPANILVSRSQNGGLVAKLADFGQCKRVKLRRSQGLGHDGEGKTGDLESVSSVASFSSASFDSDEDGSMPVSPGGSVRIPREVLGTLLYLAPDRWKKVDDVINPESALAADIYALAMVAYQCFEQKVRLWSNLRHPWAVYHEVVVSGGRPTWEKERERPRCLIDVVEKCWTQDPTERLSAAQLGIALHNVESGWKDDQRNSTNEEHDNITVENVKKSGTDNVEDSGVCTTPNGGDQDTSDRGVQEKRIKEANSMAREEASGEALQANSTQQPNLENSESNINLSTFKEDISSSKEETIPTSSAVAESSFGQNADEASGKDDAESDSDAEESVPTTSVADEEKDKIQPTLLETSGADAAPRDKSVDAMDMSAEESIVNDGEQSESRTRTGELTPPESETSYRAIERIKEPAVTKPHVEEYAFRDLVEARDYESLLSRAIENTESIQTTEQLVKALELLLETDDYEEYIIQFSAVYTLVSVLSRHGRYNAALCASICRCYVRLARKSSEPIERELRSNAVVSGALDTISWHPTNIPALLAASMALAALGSASRPLCNQIVSLDGRSKLHRALSRALSTFDYDVPLTLAALNGIESIAVMIPDAVAADGSAQEVLRVCRSFLMERKGSEFRDIASKCLRVLAKIANTEKGVKSILEAGGVPIVTASMNREAENIDTLRSGCDVIRKVVVSGDERVAEGFSEANVIKVLQTSVQRGGEVQDFTQGCRLAGGAMRVLRHVSSIHKNLCHEITSSGTVRVVAEAMTARQEHSEVVKEGAMLIKDVLAIKRSQSDAALVDRYMEVEKMLEDVQATWIRNTDVSLALKEALDALRGVEQQSPPRKAPLSSRIRSFWRR